MTKFKRIFYSRTIGPISTKLGTKHPRVNGIQVCSNEGPRLTAVFIVVLLTFRFIWRTMRPISDTLFTKLQWAEKISFKIYCFLKGKNNRDLKKNIKSVLYKPKVCSRSPVVVMSPYERSILERNVPNILLRTACHFAQNVYQVYSKDVSIFMYNNNLKLSEMSHMYGK